MRSNFHETYSGSEVKPPSDRSTGLLFAAVALIFAALWRHNPNAPWVALGVAVALLAVSLIAPALLRPINLLWFRFGLLLHRVVSPVVMFLMFAVVFVPAGAIMRLRGDPLRLRRETPAPSSYWVERTGIGDAQTSMTAQF
jgi:Saxitoxin biosynthesis operon protein SxtJ